MSGRSPGGAHGNPLQYSCLDNPMDRGAGGLQFIGSQRVRHNWVTWLHSTSGSSVHGTSQGRILEWVAISSSRGSSWHRDQTHISCIGRQILYWWATREPWMCLNCIIVMFARSEVYCWNGYQRIQILKVKAVISPFSVCLPFVFLPNGN